jgi:hypothetical protein
MAAFPDLDAPASALRFRPKLVDCLKAVYTHELHASPHRMRYDLRGDRQGRTGHAREVNVTVLPPSEPRRLQEQRIGARRARGDSVTAQVTCATGARRR